MIRICSPQQDRTVLCGLGQSPILIAGPCVIESRDMALRHADALQPLSTAYPFLFKASYDKANRTDHTSFRGIGIERGLGVLAEIRREYNLPVLTDVHTLPEVEMAAEVVDMLQIPAFLCRQTDLLQAAGLTGKPVNIKKGQFMPPLAMRAAADKITLTGNPQVCVTERGSFFGYGDLVVDFRGVSWMQHDGLPVVFDATHACQRPGPRGTAGAWQDAEPLARAALGVGVQGLFFEVHEDPPQARSDPETQIPLAEFVPMLERLHAVVPPWS